MPEEQFQQNNTPSLHVDNNKLQKYYEENQEENQEAKSHKIFEVNCNQQPNATSYIISQNGKSTNDMILNEVKKQEPTIEKLQRLLIQINQALQALSMQYSQQTQTLQQECQSKLAFLNDAYNKAVQINDNNMINRIQLQHQQIQQQYQQQIVTVKQNFAKQQQQLNTNAFNVKSKIQQLQNENNIINIQQSDLQKIKANDQRQKMIIQSLTNENNKLRIINQQIQQRCNLLWQNNQQLTLKYIELENKYQAKTVQIQIPETNNYLAWSSIECANWIVNINKSLYQKYYDELLENMLKECVDGSCFNELTRTDLYRFGISAFNDQCNIYNSIQQLIYNMDTNKNDQQNEGGKTCFSHSLSFEKANQFYYDTIPIKLVCNVQELLCSVNKLLSYAPRYLGLDMEWKPNFVKGQKENKVSLIQIAHQRLIILIRINKFKNVYESLYESGFIRNILQNENILKCGVGILDDQKKLLLDYNINIEKCVELNRLNLYPNPHNKPARSLSLKNLCKKVLKFEMKYKKKNITMSNWANSTLSKKQIMYAAEDGIVGYLIFDNLIKNNDNNVLESLLSQNIEKIMDRKLINNEFENHRQQMVNIARNEKYKHFHIDKFMDIYFAVSKSRMKNKYVKALDKLLMYFDDIFDLDQVSGNVTSKMNMSA